MSYLLPRFKKVPVIISLNKLYTFLSGSQHALQQLQDLCIGAYLAISAADGMQVHRLIIPELVHSGGDQL